MTVKKTVTIKILSLALILVLVNVVSYFFFERFDLTKDQRYTLSGPTKKILSEVQSPLIIDVFLQGDFPSEFRKLQSETLQLLEEFQAENPNLVFNFINPLEEGGEANTVASQFYEMGMVPARINVVENGRSSETIIFPWAMANYGQASVIVPLLNNKLGATSEERVSASVQQLEYVFADAITKLIKPKSKKIAVMRGNGELADAYIADFLSKLQEYYFIAPFTLDSVAVNPQRTFQQLQEYDLILEAKPTQAYSEAEKYVLDQYVMQGGKAIWLVDAVAMETDSLFTPAGAAFAVPRELNLGDFFFKYGVRINPVLVKDLYSAPIILASGRGSSTEFNPYPWYYYPLSASAKNHPIVNNLEAVRFEYASPLDTLKNSISKRILLSSSPMSKIVGTPAQINLSEVNSDIQPETFSDGEQALAVLLEGKFTSVYENRLKPFNLPQPLEKGEKTAMLVISDGDVIKNELQQGTPIELGFDRYTGTTYGNKEFLLNAVNYLLDDTGLVDLRSKEISIAFMDLVEVEENRLYWQVINILAPLAVLGIFGGIFVFLRRRRYLKKA